MSSQKPALKLRLNTSSSIGTVDSPVETSTPKIKLKIKSSQPPTPSEAPKILKKPGRKPAANGTPSSSVSKKRAIISEPSAEANPIKKLKLTTKQSPLTPRIKTKLRGHPPPRMLGVGYDSEADDIEEDPAIEEDFILRMEPGDDCEYIRKAINEGRIGLPISKGGPSLSITPLTHDGRRALVDVRGKLYGATLVDLPCIVEGMKSWDKKSWMKSVDICQMLLVIGRVKNASEAQTIPLPQGVDPKTFQYAHGLTPPMRWARQRRFRKRVSNRVIEEVEEEVERLLTADQDCEASTYDIVDLDRMTRENSAYEDEDSDEDAEGEDEIEEDDLFDEAELEAQLDKAMKEHGQESALTTPAADVNGPNPSVVATPSAAADTGDDSSGDEEEEEEEEELDEETLAKQREEQRLRDEIKDLENNLEDFLKMHASMTNVILRMKQEDRIRGLRQELELKRAALGEQAE
ncbi:MAG: hypothetical protein M1824_004266 [Vezdaea acicularis]|nr:MAG: hypothetical protein M1824_004266 [Vezdaea acicularis]